MNNRMLQDLELDEVNNCPHNSENNCSCRKPKPGMIKSSAERLGIDLSKSWIVGDRDGDITAGSIAGLRTVFIDRKWIEESGSSAEFRCLSLTEAVSLILRHSSL
jgi:D-glycero-D-manno-heptose 1,7-bisphosphate phosphatase